VPVRPARTPTAGHFVATAKDCVVGQSDLPVQVDHQAALGLMVLPIENLMVLPNAPSAAGRSKRGDFESDAAAAAFEPRNLPANILVFSEPFTPKPVVQEPSILSLERLRDQDSNLEPTG